MNTESLNKPLTHKQFIQKQRELEHQILRSLVEDHESEAERLINPSPTTELVDQLKELCKSRALAKPGPVELDPPAKKRALARDGNNVAAEFGWKVFTEAMLWLIHQFEIFFAPVNDSISWCNGTEQVVHVRTFDGADGLRWIGYMECPVPPQTVVSITARGPNMQVLVIENGHLARCVKNQAYYFTGNETLARTK
jgi:hypothetical protein